MDSHNRWTTIRGSGQVRLGNAISILGARTPGNSQQDEEDDECSHG